MSVVSDTRQVIQDFLAPELREVKARIESVEAKIDEHARHAEARHLEFKDDVQRQFGDVQRRLDEQKQDTAHSFDEQKQDTARRLDEQKQDIAHSFDEQKQDTARRFDEQKQDTAHRFDEQKQDTAHRFDEQKQDTSRRFQEQRQDMDRRFEEQRLYIEKRFENVDRRFDEILVAIRRLEDINALAQKVDALSNRMGQIEMQRIAH